MSDQEYNELLEVKMELAKQVLFAQVALDKARDLAAELEYGKYGTRHLGAMLALSHAREYHLRSAVELIRDQSLNYVEIADIAKDALSIPAPPVVLKEKYDADVAEMNERLVDRRKTLISISVECEEMRKALERERAKKRTARELPSLAASLLREANAQGEAQPPATKL